MIKSVTAMTDQKTAYLVLAIENQSNIHYAMAVKNMVYDALQYAKQVERAIASHKKSGDYKGADSDEYLSGFMRDDHLMPVMTLVIYFDAKKWDGPMSIHEMFKDQDAKILSLVPDYKINLIAPAQIPDEDFDKFSSTLREVLAFIKYSRDADKLQEAVTELRPLGRSEVNVINSCTNSNLTMNENEEVLDMCEAIQTIEKRAKTEGRISALLLTVKKLMEGVNMTAEQFMDFLDVSEDDRKVLFTRL